MKTFFLLMTLPWKLLFSRIKYGPARRSNGDGAGLAEAFGAIAIAIAIAIQVGLVVGLLSLFGVIHYFG